VYDSRPQSVIITLGRQLYMISEIVSCTIIYLIFVKKCSKVISNIGKFIFFMIHDRSKEMVVATFVTSRERLSLQ
jgi:hypothetical protein